jgi:signal transduction histidine kinase
MTLSTRIFFGFSIVIGLSLINSYANFVLSQKVKKNTAFLARSETIIRNSSKLNRNIIDMQSAHRGYLLTDDSTFLEPYFNGLKSIPELYKEEIKLVSTTPSQRAKLDSIYELHQQWVNYARSLIDAKQNSKESLPNNYNELFETKFKAQVGKKINDSISTKFQEFDRYEYKIRGWRREVLNDSIIQTQYYSLGFIMLTILIGLLSILFIIRIISKRIASMVQLADNISRGHFVKVYDNKNDELTSLSVSLNLMSETLSKNINELEKRNKELDQFAYVVSHDLKAPIRGIYNAVQWIREDLENELSAQMKKYLNIIPGRIKRMDELIDALLHYARISRSQPEKVFVDVNVLLRDIVESIVPEDFEVVITEMPSFTTEKIRLEQVFSNLISNSVKYAADRPVKIIIDCRELKNFYEFTVSDNGIGIDSQYFQKIFVIFQTLREKHAIESTGIGLAIVHKIIEDQHCNIKVESKLGEGSSFIFTWPKQ